MYELSDSLLARGKNLWPFCCGIVAVFHTKTVRDCVTCVNALTEILATRWQALHPSLKRPKRRVAPLKWMCDKFHSIGDNTAFLSHHPEDLSDLNAAFGNLQDILDALLPDNDLTFRSILRERMGGGQAPQPESGPANAGPANKNSAAPHPARPMSATLDEIEKTRSSLQPRYPR